MCSSECTSYSCLKGAPEGQQRTDVPNGCPYSAHSNALVDNSTCSLCSTWWVQCLPQHVSPLAQPPAAAGTEAGGGFCSVRCAVSAVRGMSAVLAAPPSMLAMPCGLHCLLPATAMHATAMHATSCRLSPFLLPANAAWRCALTTMWSCVCGLPASTCGEILPLVPAQTASMGQLPLLLPAPCLLTIRSPQKQRHLTAQWLPALLVPTTGRHRPFRAPRLLPTRASRPPAGPCPRPLRLRPRCCSC